MPDRLWALGYSTLYGATLDVADWGRVDGALAARLDDGRPLAACRYCRQAVAGRCASHGGRRVRTAYWRAYKRRARRRGAAEVTA